MNFVLIGMRGSGKTTIGKRLAAKLKRNFVETDELVEMQEGLQIREIVKKFGWSKFRESESKIMIDLALRRTNDVIATGGGIVENQQNIARFKSNNDIIIWLNCSIDKIIERIGNDKLRPFITNENSFERDLRKVYKGREPLYKKFADIIISSNEDVKTVVNNIIAKLEENNSYD